MSKRLIVSCIALLVLTACASPSDEASAPPSNSVAAQAPTYAAPPPAADNNVGASNVTVPVAAPPRPASDDEVVVPGVQNQQVAPPRGDPRTTSQRMADIRAWDDCVMRAQGQAEGDPTRPQLNSPEDICRRHLGMSSRTALPESRRP